MKKYIIICVCLISFLSCKKANTDPAIEYLDNHYYSEINMTYDGNRWGQSTSLAASLESPTVVDKADGVSCRTDNSIGLLGLYNFHPKITLYSEQLFLEGLPLKKGKYKIKGDDWKRQTCIISDTLTASFGTNVDSDAGGSSYIQLPTTRDNYVIINYYDAGKRELQGELDIAFIAPIGPGAPADTIFLKGSFKVRKL